MLSTKKYVALSTLAASVAIMHAFTSREQFFPSMVYLSTSKISIAILGNLGFALALGLYKLLTLVFLGRLREAEVERINDKISQAIVETLLAMTIFREDFTISFVSMFVILSFVKIFHWLVQDRVDFIETTPNVTRLQHVRIIAFAAVLMAIDVAFLRYTISRTMRAGVSIHLLFAFEYAIQASTILTTFLKYILTMIDMATEGGWEGKGLAVFYLDLSLDLLHLIVYTCFFAVIFSTYGIPIHLVRDLYWTFRNFQIRVRDFLRYRRITANMEARFPDATPEDLERAGHVCIVCREEMTDAGSRCKRLGCNHVFHLHCLRSWLERQQNCPICRAAVVPAPEPVQDGAGADVDGVQPANGRAQNQEQHAQHAAQFLAEALARHGGLLHDGVADQHAGQYQDEGAAEQARPGQQHLRRRRRDAAGPAQLAPTAAAAVYPQQQQQQWVAAAGTPGGAPIAGQQLIHIPVHIPMILPPYGANNSASESHQMVLQQGGTPEQQQAAAMVASYAAAAASAATSSSPFGPSSSSGGAHIPIPTDPVTLAAMKASAQAMKALLEGQLASLHSHLERVVSQENQVVQNMQQQIQPPVQQQQQNIALPSSAAAPAEGSTSSNPMPPSTSKQAEDDKPSSSNTSASVVSTQISQQMPPPQQNNNSANGGGSSGGSLTNTANASNGSQRRRSESNSEADEIRRRRLQRFGGA